MKIHPSSIIHPSSKIDESVEIGPFCIIGENVEISKGTKLLSHVVLKGPTFIGENNIFYQFSTIGEDTPDKKFKGEKTKLEIGHRNIFREGVTVHRGTVQDKGITFIGSDNLLMAYTHVAHDCIVGNDNVFANNAGIAGHVKVGSNISIGALTTIHQFCNIGDYSFIGMNTSINMDVPAYVKVAADPARVIGLNSVGMTRNHLTAESISLIKKAYKLVYRKGLKIGDAINKSKDINKDINDSHLKIFINSLEVSERGILR
ncbi:MAG: acyl-ACP--UDP-N-acetylglucosamine O-acyltransferase [SAR86 cluster bacterium]|jgi:UDP-N-acetylglucosamine acyltransferase|uniref:Acyl-ACP--UDP-N-acetylglucosamine O-acyltransferase n=1 Tax=SAR86 cluster bacterium TaxID=2030880 RepID=A0A520MXJ8_9GAMM|nr:MAG: acyl-ACP--UDP-N-acetylglucosamine O-acyltransferase [Gammaproteobacteria bacterium TMED225]RZO25945.1 MAG: acyl-ACP--UDP-N-acetylglucosamine O-acyltransferase [SAR86 cluster bacterium]|tara:strand:- start:249 stop:1028 length:780 start_codon:yes stop_codon:yes gene_type:complete